MYSRLLTPPKGSFFLLGPRGTGKTTWLNRHFATAKRIDLLGDVVYQRYLAEAGAFQPDGIETMGLVRFSQLLDDGHLLA